jgi:hypothetical protein
MSDPTDNAAKLINLLAAVQAAGVYDETTNAWSGPVVPESPVTFTLTYSTAADTVPAATVAAVPTTSSTTTTPYGYSTQAQADDIPVAINALTADVLALRKVIVALVNVLVSADLALS